MNIMIHGATNGSNFGDCLFAHVFYEHLKKENSVSFLRMPHFGIGEYLIKELDNLDSNTITLRKADCLLYMSGGYFGDTTGSMQESLKRFIRYFLVSVYFLLRRKPIYICGVGGGPIRNILLRKYIVYLMNKARFISVRDESTAKYFCDQGVQTPILITSDTALVIKDRSLPNLPEDIAKNTDSSKNIFFHVLGSDTSNLEIQERILPALNKYLEEHKDYKVFVGTDNKCKQKIEDLIVYRDLIGDKIPVNYLGTWQMCSLISKMDIVITVKLHVGIVASLYGKSVISFPKHKTKTKRFYAQIGCPDRCQQLSDVDSDVAYSMIERFASIPIKVNDELIERARCNLISLQNNKVTYENKPEE